MCDSHVKLVKLIRDHTIVSSYIYCEFFSCEAMSHWLHWKGFSPVWFLPCNEVSHKNEFSVFSNILFCCETLLTLVFSPHMGNHIALQFGMNNISHWLNRWYFIFLAWSQQKHVILIKLIRVSTNFHCFFDFNRRGFVFNWCYYS